jgi:uncharacterized protein (TIGR02118 family)
MIKVSVMYPNVANARFDHDYYRDTHMPLVKTKLGEGCTHYTVDKGIAGGSPDSAAPYVAMCHVFSGSVEAFEAGMKVHGKQIFEDIIHFTDLTPVIQVSEVIVG